MKKRIGLISAVLLALSLFVGCTIASQFAPAKYGQTYPPRTPPDQIELFRSQTPTRKYVEIGSVTVCCGGTEETVNLLREKAAEKGGDALIGLDVTATGNSIATVIRYE